MLIDGGEQPFLLIFSEPTIAAWTGNWFRTLSTGFEGSPMPHSLKHFQS